MPNQLLEALTTSPPERVTEDIQLDLTLPEHQRVLLDAITTYKPEFHMATILIVSYINTQLGTNITYAHPNLDQPTPASAIQLINNDYWIEGSTLYFRRHPVRRGQFTGRYSSTSGEKD